MTRDGSGAARQGVSGPAQREFLRNARRLSSVPTTVITVVIQAAALLVVPPEHRTAALVALGVVTAWRVVATVALYRGPAPWVLPVDAAVVVGLCVLQPVIDVPRLISDDAGWVLLASEGAIISWQWQFDGPGPWAATLAVSGGYAVGAHLTEVLPTPVVVASTVWPVAAAAVSRGTRNLLFAAAVEEDRESARRDDAAREVEVAEALRDAELAHLATLHDTVAGTLLMVGLGAARPGPALRDQAARDLTELLTPRGDARDLPDPDDSADLAAEVAMAVGSSPVTVELSGDLTGPTTRTRWPKPVVRAVTGALGEALRNTARHSAGSSAGSSAAVHVEVRPAGMRVTVLDHGGGFAPGARPGRGIRHSIIGRMERVGGTGTVRSTGRGVLVELAWTEPEPAGAR